MGNVSENFNELWVVCHYFMPSVSKQLWVVCSWVVIHNLILVSLLQSIKISVILDHKDCYFLMSERRKNFNTIFPRNGPKLWWWTCCFWRWDLKRWTFDGERCVPFKYGGCRGNRNRFLKSSTCRSACLHRRVEKTPCELK